jgi:Ca-activated chloride channel homolog
VSFGHPILLLTLLFVPAAVAVFLLAERRRMRYAVRFTNVDVLASVAGTHPWRRYVPPLLFLLALATACVATARPRSTTLVPRERATVILVLDVSRSMSAQDVKPTRLLAAESAVRTFLDRVPKRLRVGLIAFAGSPTVVAQPTTDHELVRDSLAGIADYGSFGGTAIGDALAQAVQLGRQAVASNANLAADRTSTPTHGLVSILFLSDGAQRNGVLLPMQGADRAKAAGIPVYTIALGTPNGTLKDFGFGGFSGTVPVPPDPDTLHAIADRTGGKFFEARSSGAASSAYAELGSKVGRKPAKTEITYAFLGAAAALLLAAGLLSAAWSPRLP